MNERIAHKILIVDNKDHFEKIFDEIIADETYTVTHEKTAESALKIVQKTKEPFSIIICEQELSGVPGIRLLEKCLGITPNTQLFLMADTADVDSIINGVNKGAIHRYLERPLTPEKIKTAVKDGTKMYDFLQGNAKLLKLAKNQNAKLYQLNCDLMEAQKTQEKAISQLEIGIQDVEKDIKHLSQKAATTHDIFSEELTRFITDEGKTNPEKIQMLFNHAVKQLHTEFTDLANRNGFEMPPK